MSDHEERLLTGYTGRVVIGLAAGNVAINLGRRAVPPLLPAIVGELSITPSEAGVALTVLFALFAAAQYPGGRISDDLTRKTVLVVGVAVVGLGFVLLSRAWAYPALLAAAGLIGLGAGLYGIALRTTLSDLFVERRGQAFGVLLASTQGASVLAAGLAVAVLAVATWRAAFLPLLVLLAAVIAALHAWVREPYAVSRVDLDLRATVLRVVGSGEVRWLLVAYALVIFTWQGAVGFLPTFLQAEKGLSSALASGGFALLFVVGAAVQPVAGGVSDRTDRILVAAGLLVIASVGLGALVAFPSSPWVVVAVPVFAVGLMGFPPVVQSHLLDLFPDDSAGGDFGAFRTIYMLVASLGATYVGVVAERASYTVAFAGFIACLFAAALVLLRLTRRG